MKKLLVTVLLVGLAGLVGAEEEKAPRQKGLSILDADAISAAEVTQLYAEFTKAWNRHDPKALAALWSLDGDHVEPDGTTAKGRSDVQKLFTKEHETVFKGTQLTLNLSSVWLVTEDVALADGTYKLVGAVDPKGNKIEPREGKLTSVLLREDGKWWVAASRLMIPMPLVWKEK